MSERRRFWWLAFFGVLAILCLRDPKAFFRAEFWAEDGAEFFTGTLTGGISSVFWPVTGYFLFIPRLLASLTMLFPVVAAPYLYVGFCSVISAAVMAFF